MNDILEFVGECIRDQATTPLLESRSWPSGASGLQPVTSLAPTILVRRRPCMAGRGESCLPRDNAPQETCLPFDSEETSARDKLQSATETLELDYDHGRLSLSEAPKAYTGEEWYKSFGGLRHLSVSPATQLPSIPNELDGYTASSCVASQPKESREPEGDFSPFPLLSSDDEDDCDRISASRSQAQLLLRNTESSETCILPTRFDSIDSGSKTAASSALQTFPTSHGLRTLGTWDAGLRLSQEEELLERSIGLHMIREASVSPGKRDALFGLTHPYGLPSIPPDLGTTSDQIPYGGCGIREDNLVCSRPISKRHRATPSAQPSRIVRTLPVDSPRETLVDRRCAVIAALQRLTISVLQELSDAAETLISDQRRMISAEQQEDPAVVTPYSLVGAGSSTKLAVSLSIELARRGERQSDRDVEDRDETSVNLPSNRRQSIVFPRRKGVGKEARLGGREVACFLRIVELLLEGLIADRLSTKRDLYYRDVTLFRKQRNVDALVEDLAATLSVRRSDLNVIATSKGIFSGSLRLHMRDGTVRLGSAEGTLIPSAVLIERVDAGDLAWVLVVEKDAIFQSLSSDGLSKRLGKGALMTAKGYPDVASRELLKRLADNYPSVPIMLLVDADPHGIEILSTFVLGSSALTHDSSNLAIGFGRGTWIGLKPTSLRRDAAREDQLLLLSPRERKKIVAMIRRNRLPAQWRHELEYMLHLNRKAEIEILSPPCSTSSCAWPSTPDTAEFEEATTSALNNFVLSEIQKVMKLAYV